jgi:hypothetical protein
MRNNSIGQYGAVGQRESQVFSADAQVWSNHKLETCAGQRAPLPSCRCSRTQGCASCTLPRFDRLMSLSPGAVPTRDQQ